MSLSGTKAERKDVPKKEKGPSHQSKDAHKKQKNPSQQFSTKRNIVYINDKQARELFLASVATGDIKKVNYWLDKFYSDVATKITVAFKIALDKGHHHLLRLLYDAQRKYFTEQDPDTLELLPMVPSEETFFGSKSDKKGQTFKVLTKKGMVFVLNHYYKDVKILYVTSILIKPIDLFAFSKEHELIIVYDLGHYNMHRLIVKCERESDKIVITKIDSTPTNEGAIDDFDKVVELIEADKEEYDEEFVYCSNSSFQQHLTTICGTFAVTNIGLAKDKFYQRINPLCVLDNDQGVVFYNYEFPPDFMQFTGSYSLLIEYMANLLNYLQTLDPKGIPYKTYIHMLDQLIPQACQPRELKEPEIKSPVVVKNKNFEAGKQDFVIKCIADAMPKDKDEKQDGSEAPVIVYDSLADFLQHNRGEHLRQRFVSYMNSFPRVYKNRTAEIHAEEQASIFRDKIISLSQINEMTMRYDAMLYDVSASGEIVPCQKKLDKRLKNQNQRFILVRDMALQSWVLTDERRRNHFVTEARKKFPHLKVINPIVLVTEEIVLEIFKVEGLAAAYAPYPVDFFRRHITVLKAEASAPMDLELDKKQDTDKVPTVKEGHSSSSSMFSQVTGKRKRDTQEEKEECNSSHAAKKRRHSER